MRRSLAIVLALAARAHAEPVCTTYARYEAMAEAAARTSYTHFRAVLDKLKLTIVAPTVGATWSVADAAKTPQVDTVEERDFHGQRSSYLIVGVSTCKPPFELVRDGSKLFRVVRKPIAGKVTKLGAVCGCGPNRSIGSCGGGAPKPALLWGVELPPGTTFAGTRTIEYVEDRVDATFANGPCPAPP